MKWGHDQAFAEFQPALSQVEEEAALMYSRDDRKVFLILLAEAKSRIFADYERASGKLRAFLLALMRRLIDSQLSIKSALKDARLHYNCASDFNRVTGMRPREYVEYHRLRLAQGILRYTGAKVYTVANTVGYSDSVFSRVYGNQLGHKAKDEPKADPAEVGALLEGMPSELLNPGALPDPRMSPDTAEETIEAREGFIAQGLPCLRPILGGGRNRHQKTSSRGRVSASRGAADRAGVRRRRLANADLE
jgi:AraC-like DNA-binding protein